MPGSSERYWRRNFAGIYSRYFASAGFVNAVFGSAPVSGPVSVGSARTSHGAVLTARPRMAIEELLA